MSVDLDPDKARRFVQPYMNRNTVCAGFLQTTPSSNRVKCKVCTLAARKVHVPTVLPAKCDFMFCLQSYQDFIIERSLVYLSYPQIGLIHK